MKKASAPSSLEDTSRITDNAIAVAAIVILILSYCVMRWTARCSR